MDFDDLTETDLELLLVIMSSGTTSPAALPNLVAWSGNQSLSNRLRLSDYDDVDRLWLRLINILYPDRPKMTA